MTPATERLYSMEEIMAAPSTDRYHGPACPNCQSRFTKRGTFTDGTRYCCSCRRVFDLRQWIEQLWGRK